MTTPVPSPERPRTKRMPSQSLFYDRIVPAILIALALVMLLLITIAAGVLLGIVHYS